MKLDPASMVEWQPNEYQVILDFLNLRAQVSEVSSEKKRIARSVNSFAINAIPSDVWTRETPVVYVQQISISITH